MLTFIFFPPVFINSLSGGPFEQSPVHSSGQPDFLIKLLHISISIYEFCEIAFVCFVTIRHLIIIIHLITLLCWCSRSAVFICLCWLNLARNAHTQSVGDGASCVSSLLRNLGEINLAPEKSHDQRLVQAR